MPSSLRFSHGNHLEPTADGQKTHIVCLKSRKAEMSAEDNIDLRTFYWCAN